MNDPDPTDAERLEDAIHTAVLALVEAIGLPPEHEGGPRVAPEGGHLVSPEHVPAGQHIAARNALIYLGLALSVTATTGPDDPSTTVTVEEGLAILTRNHTPRRSRR